MYTAASDPRDFVGGAQEGEVASRLALWQMLCGWL